MEREGKIPYLVRVTPFTQWKICGVVLMEYPFINPKENLEQTIYKEITLKYKYLHIIILLLALRY